MCRFALGFACLAIACGEPEEAQEEPEEVLVCPDRENCVGDHCEQVLIEESDFLMGADHPPHEDAYWPSGDERPIHEVHVDAYCMDKYEVSLERYETCVDAGVCEPDGLQWGGRREVETVVNHYADECYPDLEDCFDHAVNAKNYSQAQTYCEWEGGRLCTEAEWERAANGPGDEQRDWPWGNKAPNSKLVNIPSTGTGYVEAVDDYEKGASVEGIFNLAGNVYEWVEDRYDLYPDTDEVVDNPTNPPTSLDDEVVGRGSCFFTEPVHAVQERSIFPMDFDWG